MRFKRIIISGFVLASAILISHPVLAAEPVGFTVDKAKTSVKFTAIENAAPVTGEFKDYDAKIAFSPDNLAKSSAVITIKMDSISASYDEMVSSLKEADWFDVKTYPAAKFEVKNFKKLEGNNYEADGNLTIRDKTQPVVLKFNLKEFDAKHAVINGSTTISRNAFGVGQGEWKDTKSVKDEVKIDIHLEAAAK